MKKTIFYSICGCFITGVAVAGTLYIDFGNNCPNSTLCSVQPNAGACCAPANTVNKINLPTGSNGWSLSIGTRTIQIFDANGNPIINNLSDTQKMIINNAIAGGATLSGAVIPASEQLVTVTLDMKGGSLPVGFTQTTRTMHPGDLVLSAGVTRSDNAKFVGFYAQGASDTTASPIITVGNATTQKYIAKYTCDNDSRTYMNSKGTCVDEDTVYLYSDGTSVPRDQVDIATNTCNWLDRGKITLHDYHPGANDFSNLMYYYAYLSGPYGESGTNVTDIQYRKYVTGDQTSYFGPWVSPNLIEIRNNAVHYIQNDINNGEEITYLKTGSPNEGVELYCAGKVCYWGGDTVEYQQVVYYVSTTTDCSECGADCANLSFDKNGVHYYYYQCPCDTYHNKDWAVLLEGNQCFPASADYYIYHTEQETETDDNGVDTTANYTMAVPTTYQNTSSYQVWGLRQPKAIGWTFRGYYDKDYNTPIFYATENTTAGATMNGFGIGNPNNREIVIGSASKIKVCTDPSLKEYDIELYGAWAKNCDGHTAPNVYQHANDITIYDSQVGGNVLNPNYYPGWDNRTLCNLNISNGGDVSYNTSCIDGYTLTSGGSSYNPICTGETGNVAITYIIKDQYGRIVSADQSFVEQNLNPDWNNYNYNTCSLQPFGQSGEGSNAQYYRILDQITFERTYNNYLLKYLATNSGSNQNWYTPSQHIPCSANEFGFTYSTSSDSYSTTVMGLACNMVCNIDKPQEGLPTNVKRCTTDNWNNYSNLSAYQSDPENVFPQCYRLVNTSLCVENLLEGCPTYECNDGYKLCVPESNAPLNIDPQCISSGSNCPSNMKEASSLVYPIPPVMNNNRGVQMR